MALTSQTVRALYNANGSTTVFAIPATIISNDSAEVVVYKRDESTTPATETLQVEGTHYTLTGASPPGTPFDTDVTFSVAPASGLKILVIRQLARTQVVDVNSNNEVIAATTIETALDRVTAITQQLQEQIDRAPKFQVTSSKTAIPLPEPSTKALLQWNTAATAIENGVTSDVIAGYATSAAASAASATGSASSATSSASSATSSAASATSSAAAAAASAATIGAPTQANKVLAGPASGPDATATFRALVGADLPVPSAATLGGTQSKAAVANQFLTSISTLGVPVSAQPAFTDVSGQAVTAQITDLGVTTAKIADDAVTNAKLANVATATFKGRTTAGTGVPEDLTATQATALLNNMVGDSGSGGTKGLVPAPAAGDAAALKFLKADGTWVAPAGTAFVAPKITSYTSGSGTFTKTGSPLYLRLRMCGGGGGGGASGNTLVDGGNGGVSSFGTTFLETTGGVGGKGGADIGGAGGTYTISTAVGVAFNGGEGQGGGSTVNVPPGGMGGASGFGIGGHGGRVGFSGGAAPANSGGGGGGSGSGGVNGAGGGGGGGGYLDVVILSPGASYAYVIGAAGTAGTGSTANGGAGAAGFIEVTEYYQ